MQLKMAKLKTKENQVWNFIYEESHNIIMIDIKGNILENNKTIGKCKEIKNVDVENNYCPVMGKGFGLYHCKRCRNFKKFSE